VNLKILLPFRIFVEKTDVSRIVAETPTAPSDCCRTGWIVWRRSLSEFSFTKRPPAARFLWSWMKGSWSKTGAEVLVSVRRAIGGTDLGQLRDSVKREFLTLDD
jgi:F-type H+-transporting ATPase subunit epsilon